MPIKLPRHLENLNTYARRRPPTVEIRRNQPGAPPGTLVSVYEAPPPSIHLFAFQKGQLHETSITDVAELQQFLTDCELCWINVIGLGDADIVRQLGELLQLHKLALEDVLNVPQRPKLETYDDKLFFIARMPRLNGSVQDGIEQVSIFVDKKFVLTIHERPGDTFEPVRNRIRSRRLRATDLTTDYLAYSVLDTIVDSYFPLLEAFGEELAEVEATILNGIIDHSVSRIYRLKRDLLSIRRAMWPQRDAILALYREPTELITANTKLHLRDCADHCNHIIDLLENYREISSSLVDLYLSMTSQRMNEIMKVLTIIATIFIPLTFIVGVYGMNFNPEASPWNMPELQWYYGYPLTMLAMLLMALFMLLFFRKKGWLGGNVPTFSEKNEHVEKQTRQDS